MRYYQQYKDDLDKPQLNQGLMLLQRCHELFLKINAAKEESDPSRWYRLLRAVKTEITFEENEELDKVSKSLNAVRGKFLVAERTKSNILYLDIEEDLEAIQETINKIMMVRGLYYPAKKYKPWEQVLEEEDI